jgi:hypothetical protein
MYCNCYSNTRGVTALYVDDLVIFVRPEAQDIWLIRYIFVVFVGASGIAATRPNPSWR